MKTEQTYVAFLRGINVGGHHKVPMEKLREEMEQIGFTRVRTLLNSGNIIFDGSIEKEAAISAKIAAHLENVFGFPVPVLARKAEAIQELAGSGPFKGVEVTRDTRLYVTFLKNAPTNPVKPPWISDDKSFRIISMKDRAVCSILDISKIKTPKAMGQLEQLFGKDITTRNWNTVQRIASKI